MAKRDGFTVAELLIIVAVIGILSTLGAAVPAQLLPMARDSERANDVQAIARRLEQAYTAKTVGQAAYPTTTKLLADIANTSDPGTVARLDRESLKAPRTSVSSSVTAATGTSLSEPKGTGSPAISEYVYQPFTSSGALCTGSDTCVRFFLYYRLERTNTLVSVKSIHQQ